MNAFFTALKTQIYQNELCNQGNKAESLLEMLFNAYTEFNGFDSSAIRKDFDELYAAMNGKTLREMDEVIYPVCTLCRDHEKTGFIEGVKVGVRLAQELDDQ